MLSDVQDQSLWIKGKIIIIDNLHEVFKIKNYRWILEILILV